MSLKIHNLRITKAAAILSTLGCIACIGSVRHRQLPDPCSSIPAADQRPFDSTRALSLTGRYRLILVSDWEDEAGRSLSGELTLQPTDTLHHSFERTELGPWRRAGSRPLWGWADLRPGKIDVPWTADPASRDPDHPGVLLHSNGALELGVWRGLDGSSTTLGIRTVSTSGFAGAWSSDLGIAAYIRDGQRLPNPHGHFCAHRE